MCTPTALWTGLFALLLSTGGAWAQIPAPPGFPQAPIAAPTIAWTNFTEPSEGAYTVEVPQGWRAAGGVRRYAASEAPTWLTAQSPDGATEIFLGDPALAPFYLPSQYTVEGAQVPGLNNRPATVMRYRPGAEYAAIYGSRSLATICANLQLQASRPLPQLEDEMRQHVQTATRLDAGEANFTCDRNGQPTVAAVIAGTGLVMFPGGNGGFWAVVAIRGYLAPAANASEAERVLSHVAASFKPNPQFIATIRQASEEAEARARAQTDAQSRMPAPSMAPTPYSPRPRASACDDLQQQRICAINEGHLVVSGGCLKCISQ